MNEINEEHLEQMLLQVKNLDNELLFSGLTIISKDLAEYTGARGLNSDDVKMFRNIYSETLDIERPFWEQHGNELFQKLSDIKRPNGFAKAAETENYDLSSLTDPELNHEWFRIPGSQMLDKFAKKFKVVICGKGGPNEQFNSGDGLLGQADLPKTIAAAILVSGLSTAAFWYPLAVYLGLLISKVTLKTYCETDELNSVTLMNSN